MKRAILPLSAICLLLMAACNNAEKKAEVKEQTKTEAKEQTEDHAMKPAADSIDISKIQFASKIDPTCGMPISAGISDTAVINGKVYGFCAKECKDEFLKTLSAKK
jgi:YHS domain-containing protein